MVFMLLTVMENRVGLYIIKTIVQRKSESKVVREIGEIADWHFFTSTSDVSKTIGGYGLKR